MCPSFLVYGYFKASIYAGGGGLITENIEKLFNNNAYQMGRVKRKSVFEHAQNVRIPIILHMRKVSSGHLLYIETFKRIK